MISPSDLISHYNKHNSNERMTMQKPAKVKVKGDTQPTHYRKSTSEPTLNKNMKFLDKLHSNTHKGNCFWFYGVEV
jgi:hypothetical protein